MAELDKHAEDAHTESDSLNASGRAHGGSASDARSAGAGGLLGWLVRCLLLRTRLFFAFFKPGRDMSVGSRKLKVVRLLAEGGFSFVYLVANSATGERYALKKVLAADKEAVKATQWEVEVHCSFAHPNLMPLIDHTSLAGTSAQPATEFRLLMPLYSLGSVHDRICQLMGRGEVWAEADCLRILDGILDGLRQFHEHAPPWAHRDIKPANVLLKEADVPVLMDFGSTKVARSLVKSRTEALLLQEDAAQNCSMAYRAPELWDPPSDCEIDERTDVWSLGCTLFAMAFYFSPFECTIGEDDQARVCECSYLRVIGGLQFPKAHAYSDEFVQLVRWLLTVDKDKRPFVHEVQRKVAQLRGRGAHDGGDAARVWADAHA
ncbi:hypothetical protein KFE25_003706 [Diacronema lutheri]|uniref:non-specific serine/threonine protein kinase n=1 Tax=Diacronema lutheri TaxID=2081491 RepID=A0A8J6C3W4_DIALT|nr:hypothetical protein KFE25_003706 [Diacronema lutheri]|mmetsp:Transcript_9360/g.29528  ORF Transcript_9360/g.29528 Transcript_9360/m.29528 type:complete len:377 (-) Transcript_9360:112-1242(-)